MSRKLSAGRCGKLGTCLLTSAILIGASLVALSANAASPQNVDRVEEDWELVLHTPDGDSGAPQFSLQMAPGPDSPWSGIFLMNFRDSPTFQKGGMQVQLWYGDSQQSSAASADVALDTPGEAVTFTLFMDRKTNGQLKYGVSQGSSATWGDLSQKGLVANCSTEVSTFDAYNSNDSLTNAQILLGAPRVQSLKLLRTRRYHGGSVTTVQVNETVYPK